MIISELIATFKELTSTFKNDNNSRRITSLSSASNNMIARFPIVCSTGLSPKTMFMVSKAIEFKNAAELKLVLNSIFAMNTDMANNTAELLRRFHDNTDTGHSVHGTITDIFESAKVGVEYQTQLLENQFNQLALHEIDSAQNNMRFNKFVASNTKNANKGNFNLVAKLTPNEVLKANNLQPTAITVKMTFVVGGKTVEKEVEVGVKTRIVPVSSENMIDNLVKAVKRNQNAFNFIKLITGEISFLKDFLFMSNQIKDDYKDKRNSMWNKLHIRGNVSKIQKYLSFGAKGLIPNTSIVMTKEEVEYVKLVHKIDLMDSKVIRSAIEHFFLSGIMIVDESAEEIYFIDDTMNDYEFSTMEALLKITNKESTNYKEVMEMIKGFKGGL